MAAHSARPRGSETQASARPRATGAADGVEWGRQIQNITCVASIAWSPRSRRSSLTRGYDSLVAEDRLEFSAAAVPFSVEWKKEELSAMSQELAARRGAWRISRATLFIP